MLKWLDRRVKFPLRISPKIENDKNLRFYNFDRSMEKISKKKLINEYKEGDLVDDIFVVKIRKGILQTSNGKYYFSLILTDSGGKSIDYKYWGGLNQEKVKRVYSPINDDSVIHLQGKVSSYQGKIQITSDDPQIIRVLESGEYEPEEFIKRTKKDVESLYLELKEYINKVNDEKLKLLLVSIFNEDIQKNFKKHPAAISIHHNWIGGLLEHTLEVIKYCELSKGLFPELNKDLLITGALLHDIGKLEEMKMTTRIKGTNKGMFSGHLVLGSILVSKKMDEIGLDEELKDKILHMIVSHHGKEEYGTPKEPMFPEAVTLYYADEASSKIAEMISFIENNKIETEDDFMPKYKKTIPVNVFLRE